MPEQTRRRPVTLAEKIADDSKVDHVDVVGEPLVDPMIWVGRQWAVTGYGVECRDGKYPIEAKRLWEEENGWTWEHQLADKSWVDVPDAAAALAVARQHYAHLKP